MLSILKNSSYLYEIKKSKFYTFLYKVEDVKDVDVILKRIRSDYKDATHCCYSYIIGNVKRFNDDGEPSGTAGMPLLEVLEKKNLNNILCVCVRYFGGIKLGAGGLIRAYATALKEAIDNNKIVELCEGYEVELELDYNEKKEIDYLFKNNIIKEEYKEKIIYTLKVSKDDLGRLNKYKYNILKDIYIEKE